MTTISIFHAQSGSNLPQKTPIMGWASWNNHRIKISEKIIKSQVDAFVNLDLNKYDYQFINIDDGYFGGRDSNGKLLCNRHKFPQGMKSLAAYIHSKGLKAGIYSDAGLNTCASFWDSDPNGKGVGLYGHETQDLDLFLNTWGYDFIKIDWCGGKWLKLDSESRYTELASYIKEIKPSTLFNICNWKFPGKWATSIAHSWRISKDIHNSFKSILKIIDKNADLWPYCSEGHFNDMDMLQVGIGMTYEEDKLHFSMWCMMHSPLILGNDLTTISEETISIITNSEIIALNQSSFIYQARKLVTNGKTEIWAKPLISKNSGEVAVALLNRSNKTQKIICHLKDIGFDHAKGYTYRDLWNKVDYDYNQKETITFTLPKHSIIVLKIKGNNLKSNLF